MWDIKHHYRVEKAENDLWSSAVKFWGKNCVINLCSVEEACTGRERLIGIGESASSVCLSYI